MLRGIDISHHQRGLDISKADVDFVICKATEGNGYVDECCDKFYQQAKACGKKLGVYHFARPDLGNTAEAEADWFIKNVQNYIKEAILILDWEPAKGQIANTEWARIWLDRVYSKTGVRPIIYMSASPMRTYDWSRVVAGNYGLWVASYGVNDGKPHREVFDRYPLHRWTFYALWQYTSRGGVNGYNGNVDMNYFSGDSEAWDKYAGTSKSEEKPAEMKKSNEEIANEVIAGKWGTKETNPTRKELLTNAGYNYDDIQAIVNEKLGITKKEQYYVVQKNDNLTKIARKYGTTVNQLVEWNKIANPNLIYVGQKLRVG